MREKRGWTQKELANRVNLNVSVMNRIESNERPLKDNELLNLANVLVVSSDYLLGRTDTSIPTTEEKDEVEFQTFANNPTLQKWYKELPKSKEEDLEKLRKMWEILKDNGEL
ncbi:helix-turn-helix transcriptional regulator [Lysinibacillus fusiformis]|uniref:helix-turn-helix domain-containing protein n=1 Tax=Lysinibacillus fusiformis TaxID=28031 RepID=UPI00196712D4|nr:helix-turn-helix transcriptional regulator [Lysinibacillus fusiformis]